jgi:predicted amidophosphoribosyltransferase
MRQQEPMVLEQPESDAPAQVQVQQMAGVTCPYCNTVNDADAAFCANCGKPLRMGACPHCGSEIDLDADFCEVCHRYVKSNVCSFCGAMLNADDAFCPECGSPKGGIVCPTCNTLNDFAFCKQCGTPLTDEARALVQEIRQQPEYEMLAEAARELDELNMQLPYTSERDVVREQMNEKMRERILMLLAKDRGIPKPVIIPTEHKRMSVDELKKKKEEKQQQIASILDKMAIPPMASPAKARNFAMAQKPVGVRLAWVCNYKHAMHSSPCGCAKPQLGGKWIILGKTNRQEIKDDK